MGIRGVGRGEGRAPRTVEDFVKNLLLQDFGKKNILVPKSNLRPCTVEDFGKNVILQNLG